MARWSVGLGAAVLAVAMAGGVPVTLAQQPGFYIELNNAGETGAGCDATFFVSNRTADAFDQVTLYVVLFDRNARAHSDMEVPIGRLAPGKAGVQGAQTELACAEISALFLNGVTCGDAYCPSDIEIASRAGIPFADDESVLRAAPEVAEREPPPPVEDDLPVFIDSVPGDEPADGEEVRQPGVLDELPPPIPPAEYVVSVSWPSGDPADDIDTFVAAPDGSVVWYHAREAPFLRLIRDDRGNFREQFVEEGGQERPDPTNLEEVSILPGLPGEYIVNVYHYVANGTGPVPVEVRLDRLGEVVHAVTVALDHRGHEATAFRFTLDSEGNASGFSQDFESVVDRVRALE